LLHVLCGIIEKNLNLFYYIYLVIFFSIAVIAVSFVGLVLREKLAHFKGESHKRAVKTIWLLSFIYTSLSSVFGITLIIYSFSIDYTDPFNKLIFQTIWRGLSILHVVAAFICFHPTSQQKSHYKLLEDDQKSSVNYSYNSNL